MLIPSAYGVRDFGNFVSTDHAQCSSKATTQTITLRITERRTLFSCDNGAVLELEVTCEWKTDIMRT